MSDTVVLMIVAWLLRAFGGNKASSPVPPAFPGPARIPVPVPGTNTPATIPTTPATSPTTYTVKSGDTGVGLAKRATGDANRWKEILKANPDLRAVTAPNADGVPTTQIVPWQIGQTINVPPGWKL